MKYRLTQATAHIQAIGTEQRYLVRFIIQMYQLIKQKPIYMQPVQKRRHHRVVLQTATLQNTVVLTIELLCSLSIVVMPMHTAAAQLYCVLPFVTFI